MAWKCFITKNELGEREATELGNGNIYSIKNSKDGIHYSIKRKDIERFQISEHTFFNFSEDKERRLRGFIANENKYGRTPKIHEYLNSDGSLKDNLPEMPSHDTRAMILLEYLIDKSDNVGKEIIVNSDLEEIGSIISLTYSMKFEEITFFLERLVELKDIEVVSETSKYVVKERGFEKIEEIKAKEERH